MIWPVELYLNGVLIGYIIYYLWTLPYVYFMRKKPLTLIEALDSTLGKRVKIVGMFCGVLPLKRRALIDMSIMLDATDIPIIVYKNEYLRYGDEVVLSGRIKGGWIVDITVLSAIDKAAVKRYLKRKFQISIYIGYGVSILWLLLQTYAF